MINGSDDPSGQVRIADPTEAGRIKLFVEEATNFVDKELKGIQEKTLKKKKEKENKELEFERIAMMNGVGAIPSKTVAKAEDFLISEMVKDR